MTAFMRFTTKVRTILPTSSGTVPQWKDGSRIHDILVTVIGIAGTSITRMLNARKEAGHAMAERIPENDFVGLTGGHLLLRQDERVRTEIAAFIEKHR